MNNKDLYELAVKQINELSEVAKSTFNTSKYLELAKKLLLDEVALGVGLESAGLQDQTYRSMMKSGKLPWLINYHTQSERKKMTTKGKPKVTYGGDFKLIVVDEILNNGLTYTQASNIYGVTTSSLRAWVIQYRAGLMTFNNASGFCSK